MIHLTSQHRNNGLRRTNSNVSIWYSPIIDERVLACRNETVHAVIHVIVENQIADDELPVRRTAQR